MHKSLDEFEIWRIQPWTTELAALERMKKNPNRLIVGKMMSSHFLQYS